MTPLPLALAPSPSQVEALRPFVEGRRCVVVGSAPLRTSVADIDAGDITVAVNGGIASLTGRRADVWVLNSKAQDRPGSPDLKRMHGLMLDQAKTAQTGHLLLLRGPKVASEPETLETLRIRGASWQTWSVLDKPTKLWLEVECCGRTDKPCSSGILTVASVLWCGAAAVRLVGFSFAPGYHYLPTTPAPRWWRDHVEADRRALRVLRGTYGARLSGTLVEAVAA